MRMHDEAFLTSSASNSRWTGTLFVTCVSIGTAGALRATGEVAYATGEATVGVASLNNNGDPITVDTTGEIPVDIRVLMTMQSAANIFRLDVLFIGRVF